MQALEARSIDGQLRVRGVQGWASLIKKSTGEELFRGVAEGDSDKVQAIQVESGHNMSQVQQDIAHDSGSESDALAVSDVALMMLVISKKAIFRASKSTERMNILC